MHLPTVVQIIDASREKPCLGLMLKLDQREISQLMADSKLPAAAARQSSRGMATGEVTLPLLAAFQRLIDLLAETEDIPILAPIIQREIIYRLLVGDQGDAPAPDCVGGKPESADRASNRLVEGQLLAAGTYR